MPRITKTYKKESEAELISSRCQPISTFLDTIIFLKMVVLIFGVVITCSVATTAEPPPPGIADREYHRQQEQERVRQQQMKDAQPHVRLQGDQLSGSSQGEQPIIIVRDAESMKSVPWVDIADPSPVGDGVPVQGISPTPATSVPSEPLRRSP